MENENVFLEKGTVPDDKLVKDNLGDTYSYFRKIRGLVKDLLDETTEEWKYYGKKNGWLLKTLYKGRNLFFIRACEESFEIIFVFGDKAVEMIVAENISQKIKDELQNARRYAEGKRLRVQVRDERYISDIESLIKIKVDN